MIKILKNTLFIVVGSIAFLAVAITALHYFGQHRMNNAPNVTVQMIEIPTDEAALRRGQHIANAISSCQTCHGNDYSGKVFLDQPPIGRIVAPNITRGNGGLGSHFTDEDWVRAIRHGVGASGQVLSIMPVKQYNGMSNADLGALVAWLKTLPPVDSELPERHITFPGTIIFGVLAYGEWPVSAIDHHRQHRAQSPAADASAEHGEYLIGIGACRECHGAKLAGLSSESGPPPGPNLTPGGNLQSWTQGDFVKAIRHGITPDNRVMNPKTMPWVGFANMTDVELQAIWAYLKTIPARAYDKNES